MPEQTQIFAGAFGELWELVDQVYVGQVSHDYFLASRVDIMNILCDGLQLTQEELLWVVAFLAAGAPVSEPTSPPAAEPPAAGRGVQALAEPTELHPIDVGEWTDVWPETHPDSSAAPLGPSTE